MCVRDKRLTMRLKIDLVKLFIFAAAHLSHTSKARGLQRNPKHVKYYLYVVITEYKTTEFMGRFYQHVYEQLLRMQIPKV